MRPEEIQRSFEMQRVRGWMIIGWVVLAVIGVVIALPVWLEMPALAPLMTAGWLAGFWVITRQARWAGAAAVFEAESRLVSGASSQELQQPVQVAVGAFERTQDRDYLTVGDIKPEQVIEILEDPDSRCPEDVETDTEVVSKVVLSELEPSFDWDSLMDSPASRDRLTRYAVEVWDDPDSRDHLKEAAKHNPRFGALLDEVEASGAEVPSPYRGTDPDNEKFSKDVTLLVIVHGTWAAKKSWWRPGGDFWSYIEARETGNLEPFGWTGANTHGAREKAAEDLVVWADERPHRYLDIIAHSHGGNVCFLASQKELKICHLILLGTPIRLEYIPDLRNISTIHNVFSTWDKVQSPVGTKPNPRGEGRSLADTERTINHRVEDPWLDPSHSALHSPEVWEEQNLWDLVHN